MGKGSNFPRIQLLGLLNFFLGWASLIYHARNCYTAQVLEYLGMFLCASLVLVWNVERLLVIRSHHSVVATYFALLNGQILYCEPRICHMSPWIS
jgi:hypothetical protein